MADDTGSTDAPSGSDDTKTTNDDKSNANDNDSGGAGDKRAILADLVSERKQRQALEKELDAFRESQKTEQEKALDKATKETEERVRSEVLGPANERLVRAHLRAAASGKLVDPSDAARYLDLAQFKVDDNGDVDEKSINAAIVDLIKDKPHLSAAETSRSPKGDWGGGPRGKPSSTADMNSIIRQGMKR